MGVWAWLQWTGGCIRGSLGVSGAVWGLPWGSYGARKPVMGQVWGSQVYPRTAQASPGLDDGQFGRPRSSWMTAMGQLWGRKTSYGAGKPVMGEKKQLWGRRTSYGAVRYAQEHPKQALVWPRSSLGVPGAAGGPPWGSCGAGKPVMGQENSYKMIRYNQEHPKQALAWMRGSLGVPEVTGGLPWGSYGAEKLAMGQEN